MTDATWFALQVRARTELRIADDLRSEGHLVFVPFQIVPPSPRERARRAQPLDRKVPLVSGYVYCDAPRTDFDGVWDVARDFLSGRPYPIPDRQMVGLKQASGRVCKPGSVHAPLTIGQSVHVTGTAFDGVPLAVISFDEETAHVALPLMGKDHVVKVKRADVEAAREAA